jgi:hypothetical protein
MALIVVGGHSRSVGKTSVVAGIIAALPEMRWTAVKITQFGHGVCSANGEPCDCETDDHTSRFLVSGASRSLWVRTRQGMLAEAMPRLRKELAGAENAILESNSVMRFLRPDLYLTVLDAANPDFKASAKEFLDRADAVILQNAKIIGHEVVWGHKVSLKPVKRKAIFYITPPPYVTSEIVDFVREKILTLSQSNSPLNQ